MNERRGGSAVVAFLACALAASSAKAAEPPSTSDANGEVRWGLVAGGASVFVVSYGFAAAFGAVAGQCTLSCSPTHRRLLIPLVGPCTYVRGSASALGNVVLVTDGLLQIGGLAGAIVGVVWRKPAATAVSWTPVVGPGSLGVTGTF
ncbi:MAG: hypothetical protein HOO96_29970 [Polyangiaceae bacterium]|nr:hypothetical protein [Polyangiaceae bacterium]